MKESDVCPESVPGALSMTYLPGLEAVLSPLALDERHVSLQVVVHLEVGALLVDH